MVMISVELTAQQYWILWLAMNYCSAHSLRRLIVPEFEGAQMRQYIITDSLKLLPLETSES